MVTQSLKTTIQIGGGITDGLLNSFNPLRKRLGETERSMAKLNRAARTTERAMKATANPAIYAKLLKQHTRIREEIRKQRIETIRLTKASTAYDASLKGIAKSIGVIGAGTFVFRKAFQGVIQDFTEFKEVQAETGIEAARLAAISFRTRPLVPGFSPERIADFTAQAAREVQLRLQEAAAGRVGLKQYLVLDKIANVTGRGTMEPIEQLAKSIRYIQAMPAFRRASALEEVVGGTEGEIITGLFRRGKINDFLKALDQSTGVIYKAGQSLDRLWAVVIQVSQIFLLLGYTLVNAVMPVVEPLAAIAAKVAKKLEDLLRGAGPLPEVLGVFLAGAATAAAGALTILAIRTFLLAIPALKAFVFWVWKGTKSMIGFGLGAGSLALIFIALTAAVAGLIYILQQANVFRLPAAEGPPAGITQTFNITGDSPEAIGREVARVSAYGVPGRF